MEECNYYYHTLQLRFSIYFLEWDVVKSKLPILCTTPVPGCCCFLIIHTYCSCISKYGCPVLGFCYTISNEWMFTCRTNKSKDPPALKKCLRASLSVNATWNSHSVEVLSIGGSTLGLFQRYSILLCAMLI